MEADIYNKHGLIELTIAFDSGKIETNKMKHDEEVLEVLKPNCNLRKLTFAEYAGEKLPSWAMMANIGNTLPNLVKITLWKCRNCQQLPSLSRLHFLKHLHLFEMDSVVYMESDVKNAASSSKSHGIEYIFFPSLEILYLRNMKNLKGWWKEVTEESTSNDDANEIGGSSHQAVGSSGKQHLLSLQFLKLSNLRIISCPNLIVLPLCPNLENLELYETNKKLSLLKMAPIDTSSSSFGKPNVKLNYLGIDDVDNLISLTKRGGLSQLSSLHLNDSKLESTEILKEVFATLSNSLRSLKVNGKRLRYISKGLEYLTALEFFDLRDSEELEGSSIKQANQVQRKEEDLDLMPWVHFNTNLRSLFLYNLPKVVSLSRGIQCLTNLRILRIIKMEQLKEIPEWISCLSSLEHLRLNECPNLTCLPQGFQNLTSLYQLEINNCPRLIQRCQSPNGTDWPKIQHIPCVYIGGMSTSRDSISIEKKIREKCNCGVPVAHLTSWTRDNPGRRFITCRFYDRVNKIRYGCEFFEWIDEKQEHNVERLQF